MTDESRSERHALNFQGVVVRGRGRANINVQPLQPFKPCWMSVHSDSTPYFNVERVSVGKILLTSEKVPASDFAGEGRHLDLTPLDGLRGLVDKPVRASLSDFVTISVLNTSDVPHVFSAVVSGPSADWEPGERQLFSREEKDGPQ